MNYLDPTSGNFSFFAESEEERGAVEEKKTGQMVEDWNCVEGCPCKDIDEQSGTLKLRGNKGPSTAHSSTSTSYVGPQHRKSGVEYNYNADTGGASRYFKQVQSEHDLYQYLRVLISPPLPHAMAVAVNGWPDWVNQADRNTCTGLIVYGLVPTKVQVQILYDLLVPGGHLCLIAPDTQPTGHTGACLLEDAGFEIRDAILWVRGAGRTHYVAKAARQEREAGCQQLPAKKGHEAVDRKEGSAGVQNPRAGAGRTASEVRNHHPCLHPEAVVMTDRGHRPVQTIKVGDKVLAADGLFHLVEAATRHP